MYCSGAGDQLKYDYLMILYQVVDESTVCLMGHERRQTLALIQHLSCNVFLPYEVGYRDTGIQGYRDTGIQGYRDTGIQGYIFRNTGIQ